MKIRTGDIPRRNQLFILSLVVLGATAGPASADQTAAIVRDGRAAVYIVADQTVDGLGKTVIDDFTAIVKRITGAQLTAQPDNSLLPLYIGEPGNPGSATSVNPPLAREEFCIRVTPSGIYVIGGSPLGTSHGVYTMLRELGCRWVMPGAIGECLPTTKDLLLPIGEQRGKPDFTYRDIWYAYGCSPEAATRHADWLRRNRMYRPPVQHGHNLTSTLARVAPFEQRPELYSLVGGKRVKQQICTSNPEVIALVVQSIKQAMKDNPKIESYSLCPDDNTDFCECDKCKALDSGKIDSGGLPSVADRYQTFLNAVFAGLNDEYPKLKLTTYSYNRSHTDPPVNVIVDPRTSIFTTSSVYCSAHGIGDADCASRQAMRALLEKWAAVTPNLYIYEYDPVPYSGALPWPQWKAHVKETPVYKKIGVTGVSYESQDSWAAYFPNFYVGAQMMWDSSQDGNALFQDMLKSFFGVAATDMAAYYASLETVFDGVSKKVEWGISDYPKYFTPAVVETCRKALEAAEQRTVDDLVRDRIHLVRLSFDEMDAYLAIRRANSSTTFAQYRASVDKLNASIDQMAAINEDYVLSKIAKEKTSVGLTDKFARELGFVNEWQLCGPFDNPNMDGHDHAYPPEQKIDISATYEGKGGKKIGWKRNRTPEWQGYIDLLNEFDDTDWVVAYAVCYITANDGPKDVMFRVGSNDSVKVFLNGAEIHSVKTQRTATVDNDAIPVTLPKGTSTVLVKIGQAGLKWGFFFRITERDSLAIPTGVRATITPP